MCIWVFSPLLPLMPDSEEASMSLEISKRTTCFPLDARSHHWLDSSRRPPLTDRKKGATDWKCTGEKKLEWI